MPKFNVDEQTSIFEPIEVVLEGKTYVIEKVTSEMAKLTEAEAKDNNSLESLAKQMSVFTGEDYKVFMSVDLRKLGAALNFISTTIMEQAEGIGKNTRGVGSTASPQ